MATIQYERVTERELRDALESLTRAKLGISADDFLARYEAGALDLTSASVARLADLARLLLRANGSQR